MIIKLFIGAWLSISSLPGQSDTTSVILVEWRNQVNINDASDLALYNITDGNKNYHIYNISKIDSIVETDGFVVMPKSTILIALVTDVIPYKTFIYCNAKGYGTNYFYHKGYVPDIIKKPVVELLRP